jgi:AAA family ATP:ADP antiporter
MTQFSDSQGFSTWRAFFWPIHKRELKKFIPMLLIFFFITFNYNVLRCIKDTLVVTAKGSGAEVIPFIKVWAMFPLSIFLTWVFIRLTNRFEREKVFLFMIGGFLIFFFLFAFVFYPQRENMHLHNLANTLSCILPEGCKGLIAMIHYWSFTIFYAMAELWSNIVFSLLVWGFANQITQLEEANRFYGLFGVGINASGIVAGQFSIYATTLSQNHPINIANLDRWGSTLIYLLSMVVIAGVIALGLFLWLTNKLKNENSAAPSVASTKKPKVKLSLRENIRYLLSSRYILYIVAIIVSYNVIINLVEVLWKHEVKELYPEPQAFNIYMNQVTTWIGVIATLASLFFSGNALRLLGWTTTAMITPLILFITSIGFFGFFFLKDSPDIVYSLTGFSPLIIVVFFGTLQNCLSRAAKYTVFDATKETAFIPLSLEDKIKGKAAVDGLCNRLGKSGGSVIYQFLLITFSTLTASAPYVAVALFSIIGIWVVAVHGLGKQFATISQPQEKLTPTPAPVSA